MSGGQTSSGMQPISLVVAATIAAMLIACHDKPSPRYVVAGTSLELPRRPGWTEEASGSVIDAARGGIALRLVRNQRVTGSPRLDVAVEPRGSQATQLNEFLARNLHELEALEHSGGIHIERVQKQKVSIGAEPGYRVRHEYALGSGDVAITQVSTLLVLGGRGVAVTVVGRTELFTPLSGEIDALLAAMTVRAPSLLPPAKLEVVKPVDLGKLGGARD